MIKGVLWIVWGDGYGASLERSRASVAHWHRELEQHVVTMLPGSDVRCKAMMRDLSPFDLTLFLDADTTVLGKIDYGFAMVERFGIACTHSANPWQRRYHKLDHEHADETEFSSGVIFFDRDKPEVGGVFEQWKSGASLDTSCLYHHEEQGVCVQRHNDQALFTWAMRKERFNPFCLPMNWNLTPRWQPRFFGPIKILHGYDDVPPALLAWNEQQSQPEAVVRAATFP